MFGDVARTLIRLMGRRETIPSAMYPEDIPAALEKLRSALMRDDSTESGAAAPDQDGKKKIDIQTRAIPLIALLVAAEKEQVPVMWEEGARKF